MRNRATDWVADMFGEAVASIREEVVERGWFGRREADHGQGDLGWFQDHPGASEHADDNALEQLYERLSPAERAEHFSEPLREQDHDLDR